MSVYADTSFFYSLYVQQAHSGAASAYVVSAGLTSVPITSLNRFELCNAIRLSAFRRLLDRAMAALDLQMIARDIASGVLSLTPCDWVAVHAEAERLSATHTLKRGHRGMDLLHVASARTLGADCFLTFDENQARLAAAAGIAVKP